MILKASGPIYYFITDSLGCVHHSDTVNGTVAQAPKVYLGNDTTIDLNANLILDAGSFQDATYIWSNGSNQQSIQLSGSLLGLGDHPHWVRVTDKNFCRGRDTILVTVSETGSLYPHQSMGIIGYPNPVQTHLYIDSREGIAMQSIRITDQRAELVYTQTGLIGTYKQIDLGYLLPGVYTVQILTESSVYYLSIIKI
jgi:hypothetical protein